MFRSAVERAGLRLEVDWADLGEPLYLDWEMWEKVVLNLLSNALTFTFDGHITVMVRRASESAVVAVADTGTGVLPEKLPDCSTASTRSAARTRAATKAAALGWPWWPGCTAAPSPPTPHQMSIPRSPSRSRWAAPIYLPTTSRRQRAWSGSPRGRPRSWRKRCAGCLRGDAPASAPPSTLAIVETLEQPQGWVLVADDNIDMREYLQHLLGSRYYVQAVPDSRRRWTQLPRSHRT